MGEYVGISRGNGGIHKMNDMTAENASEATEAMEQAAISGNGAEESEVLQMDNQLITQWILTMCSRGTR